MKTLVAATLLGMAALTSQAGVGVGISVNVPVPPPPPLIPPPPPPVVVAPPAIYPDSYVWDGTEYVGVVGGQYYYLGPNHVWLAFGPAQFDRFHSWEHGHQDWRSHAIRNTSYRGDMHDRGPRNDMRRRGDYR